MYTNEKKTVMSNKIPLIIDSHRVIGSCDYSLL